MSEQSQEQPQTPPEGEQETTEPKSGEPPTDQELGVGVAPTEPGDAGEGNPGTQFQTTAQIEGTDEQEREDVEGAI